MPTTVLTDGNDVFNGVAADEDNVYGRAGDDTLNGNDGDDNLRGEGGNDILNGGAGVDQLDGGTGADTMTGGDGSDTYVVDDVNDVVIELSGEGTDNVKSYINITLAANVEHLELMSGLSGFGNALDNSLKGSSGNDFMKGMDGDDSIHGHGGNDTIHGGNGDDVLNGGDGIDMVSYADITTGAVTVDLGYGTAKQNTGSAGLDSVVGFENLTGTNFDDTLTGDAGANRIDGRGGADLMTGGDGNDLYLVGSAGDQTVEAAGQGTDTVASTIDWTLSDNVENLSMIGTAVYGTGNAIANKIDGNAADNIIEGKGGLDDLYGRGGADKFILDAPTGASWDAIRDFEHGSDVVQVHSADYGNIALGALNANQFVAGNAATEAFGQFLYHDSNLYFDADGTGGGAVAQQIAWLPNATFDISDIIVI